MLKTKMAVLLGVLAVSCGVSADINKGLIAYYPFEDSTNDKSVNKNHGTQSGGITYVDGVIGKAAKFDGASYISVSNSASLNPTNQLTMSFWIYVDDFTNVNSAIIYKGGSNIGDCQQNREYSVWLINDPSRPSLFHQAFAGDGNCQSWVNSKTISIKGKWLHYVGVINLINHTQSIYINGVLNSKVTNNYNAFSVNNYDLRIGFSEDLTIPESPIKGLLDEIRLYKRALTKSEITGLYNAGLKVGGTVKSLGTHTVSCKNETTGQVVNITASEATVYDCESKGLNVNVGETASIFIKGIVR